MDTQSHCYSAYLNILKEEMVPAMGCTEPIAVAYACAEARRLLERLPDSCHLIVSGNIIKNVKSVVVPNTDGMRGLEGAAAAGIIAGNAEAKLQVISEVTAEQKAEIKKYLEKKPISVSPADNGIVFYIEVVVSAGADSARVVIRDYHTNIVLCERNGATVFSAEAQKKGGHVTDRSLLNVDDIVDFADSIAEKDIPDCIDLQIEYNCAISEEGLTNDWGASVGKNLLDMHGSSDPNILAAAAAAAGSDARMSGCEMPVVIVSGSGNQGMATSLPVIAYGKSMKAEKTLIKRALIVANLCTIHQKSSIGELSAFCGATSAGCGAAAGIAYLNGGKADAVGQTIKNALGIISGMICDGAKPSCAAKIAAAVQAGLLGYQMYVNGRNFSGGDGILADGVEGTIENVGRLASEGMRQTDRKILDIMVGKQ